MPLRVLMVSWEYPPVIEGGLARAVAKLSEALAADGVLDVEVHVLTRGGDDVPAAEELSGVHVHRVSEPARPTDMGAFMGWVRELNDDLHARGLELLADTGFDVVHGHDWLVARAAKRLADEAGAPFVATVHATEYGRHQGWVHVAPQSEIHRAERWMVHVADRVLVCSHYMRDHVIDVFDARPDTVVVAPNGIDPGDLVPHPDISATRRALADDDERLVLLVGRLVYEKGFQDALEALAGPDGVIARLGKVRYVIAGSGTHEWELKAQAQRLGISGDGTFMGWIDDVVLHSLYRACDVIVVPSRFEPFGLVALEAMASGCPVIVADTGGLREVVPDDHVGLRFTPGDKDELRELICHVLEDEATRTRLAAQAAEHVLTFGWADVATSVTALYRALEPAPASVLV
ncbi:MAG: glycosyltransferase family 4 protein [Baekduia sp.]